MWWRVPRRGWLPLPWRRPSGAALRPHLWWRQAADPAPRAAAGRPAPRGPQSRPPPHPAAARRPGPPPPATHACRAPSWALHRLHRLLLLLVSASSSCAAPLGRRHLRRPRPCGAGPCPRAWPSARGARCDGARRRVLGRARCVDAAAKLSSLAGPLCRGYCPSNADACDATKLRLLWAVAPPLLPSLLCCCDLRACVLHLGVGRPGKLSSSSCVLFLDAILTRKAQGPKWPGALAAAIAGARSRAPQLSIHDRPPQQQRQREARHGCGVLFAAAACDELQQRRSGGASARRAASALQRRQEPAARGPRARRRVRHGGLYAPQAQARQGGLR